MSVLRNCYSSSLITSLVLYGFFVTSKKVTPSSSITVWTNCKETRLCVELFGGVTYVAASRVVWYFTVSQSNCDNSSLISQHAVSHVYSIDFTRP